MVNEHGKVIQSEINGVIKMKSYLSGMPELKLGLNDKIMVSRNASKKVSPAKGVELDDIKLHQCVRLSRFESDRTISFIPPDGDFDLMTYRLNTHVRPPFSVKVQTDFKPLSKIEYFIRIKSEFKQVSCANNVRVVVPVPFDADSPRFDTMAGTAKYDPSSNSFTWLISQFHGSNAFELRAKFGLPKVENEESKKNTAMNHIKLKFEIPYYTISGIQVRYLKIIEKTGYSALPWVRYATKNGNYLVKIQKLDE
ncbi:hypothetical protein MHBO_000732 [Bonamia ostreae]|uniref:MHD domain-containing protein n=1 Tax=Bonamia ostreae TaxID=126728 RepID=A0ABV2AHU7_9EUKA